MLDVEQRSLRLPVLQVLHAEREVGRHTVVRHLAATRQ